MPRLIGQRVLLKPLRTMPDKFIIYLDNKATAVLPGISLMAALSQNGRGITRRSVQGEPRSAVCGMGICQECRVTVNGVMCLACQTPVEAGMVVQTAMLTFSP